MTYKLADRLYLYHSTNKDDLSIQNLLIQVLTLDLKGNRSDKALLFFNGLKDLLEKSFFQEIHPLNLKPLIDTVINLKRKSYKDCAHIKLAVSIAGRSGLNVGYENLIKLYRLAQTLGESEFYANLIPLAKKLHSTTNLILKNRPLVIGIIENAMRFLKKIMK